MDVIDDYNRDRYNPVIHDFIKKLPGVTSRNVYAILNKVNSMGELLALSAEDLTDIVGKGNATMLYDSLHTIVRPREAAPVTAAAVAAAGGTRGKSKRAVQVQRRKQRSRRQDGNQRLIDAPLPCEKRTPLDAAQSVTSHNCQIR